MLQFVRNYANPALCAAKTEVKKNIEKSETFFIYVANKADNRFGLNTSGIGPPYFFSFHFILGRLK